MTLQTVIEQYILWRQSHGAKFTTTGNLLRQFLRHADGDAGCEAVTAEQIRSYLADSRPETRHRENKLYALAGFWRYAISRGHSTSMPLPDVARRSFPRPRPHIYSQPELRRLFDPTNVDRSCLGARQLDGLTFRTLLLLLYGAGLRFSEATGLTRADVDLPGSILTIRDTKFFKSRLVPVGRPLQAILCDYVLARPSDPRQEQSTTFLLANRNGTRLSSSTVQAAFDRLRRIAVVPMSETGGRVPRMHDLRHSFAVHSLTSWYRQDADVQRLLPVLSTYLGHSDMEGTKVYLSMTPELLQQASQRFAQYATGGHDGRA
ncbi:tyrosine-type recombinase/integrase [Haematobacter massiliensis]|uniref:tyrosine-type recombinase/integrase n=1 Tax=Haematobacter massiliensis TaxID=195105 RepID=UPI0010400C40|nr:tyrosine-type recombinase/integrase [Haematobacter massiliensis]QBJ26505.1 integrase [Haematobacter massiliensis]